MKLSGLPKCLHTCFPTKLWCETPLRLKVRMFDAVLPCLPHTALLPLLECCDLLALMSASRGARTFVSVEAYWRWLVVRDFTSTVIAAASSPVGTWREMYVVLGSLGALHWRSFDNAGGKNLRSWRTDRREMSLLPAASDGACGQQRDARLIASGGKFFFQVFSSAVADYKLEKREEGVLLEGMEATEGMEPTADVAGDGSGTAAGSAAAGSTARLLCSGHRTGEAKGTRHPFTISAPKLRKMKLKGTPPSPRRAHSLTSLCCTNGSGGTEQVLVCFGGEDDAISPASDKEIAMNDVHVLHQLRFSNLAGDQGSGAWARPPVSGELPTPRNSHRAVRLGRGRIAIVGGVRGRIALDACEVSVLEISAVHAGADGGGAADVSSFAARWARVVHDVPLPPARQNFCCTWRRSDGALVIFGGMQWGVSNALVSSYAIHFMEGDQDECDVAGARAMNAEETVTVRTVSAQCAPLGDFPGERVGHGMCAVGEQLILFGGDCAGAGAATPHDGNAIFVFSAQSSRWTRREVLGNGPGQRRGADCQRWGFSVFTAGGFTVPSRETLPDSDARELVIGSDSRQQR